ncbi:MAG: outer membrane beta-barrel protein [Bacteroidales bacterium]|nr:outer membrane beta-barrel protein [Bacteroidales bacterium]
MDKKDELKELFARNLTDWQQQPPTQVWDAVNQQLMWKSRRRLVLYSLSAAAILILMIIPLGVWMWKDNVNPNPDLAETIVTELPSDQIIAVGQNAPLPDVTKKARQQSLELQSDFRVQSTKPKSNIGLNEYLVLTSETEKTEVIPVSIAENSIDDNEDETQKVEEKENLAENHDINERLQRVTLASRILQQNDDGILEQQKFHDKQAAERMNLILAYGSVPGGTVSASELLYENSNVRYRPDTYQSEMAYETSFYEEIERTDVQAPLSFGLKMSYRVGRRIFLETGLSYTSLGVVSKTIDFDETYNRYYRTLHYLGIPFGIRWEVIRTQPFKAYLIQTVMLEKGIRAANRKNRYEQLELVSSELSSTRIPGFQLSTLSSVGADLGIYQNFSVFGEGGIQVFYLNSTQPFNMRSAKMMWPVFQTGIRMNF